MFNLESIMASVVVLLLVVGAMLMSHKRSVFVFR